MTIILLAIIAAALIFGSRVVGALLRRALLVVGLGIALVAIGLFGVWLSGSANGGYATIMLALLGFAGWACVDQQLHNRRLAPLLATQEQAAADHRAAAARLEALRTTSVAENRPIEEYWTAAAIAARQGEREQPSGGTSS